MDLHDELENAIGHGPALPTPADRLASGRRALRRRRAVVAAGAAAAVAAVVLPVAALAGGSPTSGRELAPAAPPAASTSARSELSAGADREPAEPAQQQRWQRWETIRYSTDGELEVRPGAQVLDRVDGYLRDSPQWEHSVAMEVRYEGAVHWVNAEWDRRTGSSSGSTEANDGWVDFRAWVASQAAVNLPGTPDPGNGYPDLVTTGVDGTLVAAPGAKILEQRASPDLPDNFASPSEPTAAALVERDGVRFLVLARPGDVISVPSAGHGDSLDALLAWARERYQSGEGLL